MNVNEYQESAKFNKCLKKHHNTAKILNMSVNDFPKNY